MFHEMSLKLYFMKCLQRKISQCILPLTVAVLKAVENLLRYISSEAHLDLFLKEFQLAYS